MIVSKYLSLAFDLARLKLLARRKLFTRFGGMSLLTFMAVVTLSLKGCVLNQPEVVKPFKVGMNSWPGYQVALYAKEAGLFQKRGLDVEFVRYINQLDNIRATMRGAQDASFVPVSEVMQVDSTESKPVLVMVVDVSAGSDGIAAGPDVKSVKDLKGKKVSAKLGTVSHLVLLEALRANQMKPEDVEIADVNNERAVKLLERTEISAATLWEPAMSRVAKKVGGRVIHTTADVDSLVVDTLTTSQNTIKNKNDELVNFITTWFDVMKELETNSDKIFASVANQLKMPKETFIEDYKGLKKGDVAMNRRMFEGGRLQEVYKQTDAILQSDPRHGRKIRQDVLIDASPVTKATQNWRI
jgi:NitT/TauT family transport system substrate-binding protein